MLREMFYHLEYGATYLVDAKYMWLRTSSVEAAYIYMWCVRDIDLRSMKSLLTRVNKT